MADPVELSFQYVKSCITNRKLGSGAFGDVFLAEDCRLSKKFAVKTIKLSERSDGPNDENLKSFKKELWTLKGFHHPSILDLYGFNFKGSAGKQVLVYEYTANGTLDRFLKDDNRRAILPAATRLLIMYEVARAVHFLHTGGAGFKVFHGDIKSANIYLTEDFTPRLTDCGLAKFVEDKRNAIPSETTQQTGSTDSPAIGTTGYMCPEYTSKKAHQIECDCIPAYDVYSLGVVMAELILGRLNDGNPTHILETYVLNGKSPVLDGWKLLKYDADVQVDWNADALELVCKTAVGCITPSSEDRLSTSVLLSRLHRAIILNAGRSGVVLGGDIDDDVTAMLSPIKFGERDSAITFNARDNYVVPGEALNNLLNNLSLINDGQSYAVRELVDDLMVSARSMNSGKGSSDPDGAGHGVPCSACNKRPFVVKCEGESHSLCALCIDIAVLKGPKGAVDDLELPCPMGQCSSRPFTEGDLYKHVHGNAWNCWWFKNNRLRVAEINHEQKKLASDIERLLSGMAFAECVFTIIQRVPNGRCDQAQRG
ncbi:serine/threonine kinase [Fragilaria crotonensis]|nr:serine/threonine kinase [Fragilaria crotonensis]